MSKRSLGALVLSFPLFAGCGILPDATLGASEGIPPISGSTTLDVPTNFKCGDPIADPKKKYTVTTSGAADACTFTFKQDVVAIKAADYNSKPELRGAQLVKRVDIDVTKLAVKDASTSMAIVPTDLTGKAFGSTIFTKADLSKAPPFTKAVEGAPIDALKSKLQAQQEVVIPVEVVVVLSLTAAPPAKVGLDFEAQPNIVVGF